MRRCGRRAGAGVFTPRTSAYLPLAWVGLLAPDAAEQVLLSGLVEQLRADAATAGLTVDDTLGERRNLVAAIQLLLEWGVLVETDGTVAGWGERKEEALLTVTRGLLPHLLARPLHTHRSGAAVAGRHGRAGAAAARPSAKAGGEPAGAPGGPSRCRAGCMRRRPLSPRCGVMSAGKPRRSGPPSAAPRSGWAAAMLTRRY